MWNYLLKEKTLNIVLAAWILLLYLIAIQKEQAIRRMSAAIRNDVANRLASTGYEIFHKEDVGAYVSWFSNEMM